MVRVGWRKREREDRQRVEERGKVKLCAMEGVY